MNGKFKLGSVLVWVFIGLLIVSNLFTGYLLLSANRQLKTALAQVGDLQQRGVAALDAMSTGLGEMKESTIEYTVNINEEIPINAEIPVDFVVHVPINTTIRVNQTVSVPVTIPLYGSATASVPISANIPVNMTVDVPVKQTIPVNTTVPVALTVPISIKIGDMPIADSMTDIQTELDSLSDYLGSLSFGFSPLP